MIFHWVLLILLSFFVSQLICRIVMMIGVKDLPDGGRKTQRAPMATMGGIGIFVAIVLSVWLTHSFYEWPSFVSLWEGLIASEFQGPLIFVVGLFLIGAADDVRPLSSRFKMFLIGVFSIVGSAFGPHTTTMSFPLLGDMALYPVIGIAGSALWLFVVANAVNFMDGANGIAMGTSAVMLLTFAAIFISPEPDLSLHNIWYARIAAASAFAILGFLVWNLQNRLYAGDCGALFVGGVLGVCGLFVAQGDGVWLAALILLPFLSDVFLTLLWRAWRGDKLTHAHRDHAYQLFLRRGWEHIRVSAVWWGGAIVIFQLVTLAFYGGVDKGVSFFAMFCFMLAITVVLWVRQRLALERHVEHDA